MLVNKTVSDGTRGYLSTDQLRMLAGLPHTHIYICVYVYMCMYVCMYVCIYIYIWVICAYMCI